MIVSQSDKATQFHSELVAHYEKKLMSLRLSNDKDHDAIKTANIRGRIAEVSGLLDLLTKEPQIAAQKHIDPYIAPE